ncbi:unnamed protein product [Didymodactylos carnosus]|uniref:Phytanoyl-CoA dioxygenase n=1 Tax=Didymodactylos carnosus TaxID=1234261 RepID=A0A814H9C5_9BILA|nr:unnamed protein product [Didymodactylos carnosus]CAF1007712.1 unnamed protein product [Didymodactylos carnosus]CAF3588343.1 unnamed protein product [Didymodactylos carnosus]CAF3778925.1 unnamed protein product [Didymodactylos carnosus]
MENKPDSGYAKDNNGLPIDYTSNIPRFSVESSAELEDGVTYLNENGYVVFKDVLSNDEVNSNIDLFWKHLEKLPRPYFIRRNNFETWNNWPGMPHIGLVQDYGIGQSEYMWNHPITKPNRCSVQGLVAMTDNNEFTGGLIVFPGTHNQFDELKDLVTVNDRRGDYVRVPYEHRIFKQLPPNEKEFRVGKLIKCKAGDLVIWDSRTIHCNTPALNTPINSLDHQVEKTGLLRIVAYVTMTPTSFVQPCNWEYRNLKEFRKHRKQYVKANYTLTHWPHELNIATAPQYLSENTLQLNSYQKSLITGINLNDSDIKYQTESSDEENADSNN